MNQFCVIWIVENVLSVAEFIWGGGWWTGAIILFETLSPIVRRLAGAKVSWNTQEHRSGARKFKRGAFQLQNYWISQPELTFLGPAAFDVVIR